ncbi:retrovirus-related Pol polyprotein from transposon opus [Trichonephila clavipes]|nr:retrovirus-related Pol polyprotein from transposon opus [Trichonephila clavipes]
MSEEALVDHIFVRLEPQVQDYVVVRSLKATAQLLEVMAKFEERYSCKKMQGSRNSDNVGRRDFDRNALAIPDSHIGKVVTTIAGGNVEIDLTKTGLEESQKHELQDFFNSFKGLLSDKLGLTHVFYHEIDMAVGAVLNQEQRPVVYASHTPSSAERNYTVTERECLAVVYSLNKFRTHLSALPVKVITDHAALTRLTNGKNLSSRMIGWVLKLAEFNIEWEHRSGTQNVVADVLSRNPV